MDEEKKEATPTENAMIPVNEASRKTSLATKLVEQIGRIFRFPVEFKMESKVSIRKPGGKKDDLENTLRKAREGEEK